MPKQPVNINFAQGLNTKEDPFQLSPGQFLRLENSVFDEGGLLKKRNGYKLLTTLSENYQYVTTLNKNLTVVGNNIAALNEATGQMVTKGQVTPMNLSTLPLIRNSLNQSQVDSAIAFGLICTVYTEVNGTVSSYKYAIADCTTGQNIVAPTLIPGNVTGSARVFVLGGYFIVVFTTTISTVNHLQYVAISILNPTLVTAAQDISSNYTPSSAISWDGVCFNNNLYLAYNTTAGGQAVKVTYLSQSQAAIGGTPAAATSFTAQAATMVALTVDQSSNPEPLIYVAFYSSGVAKVAAIDASLGLFLAPTPVSTTGTVLNIAASAQNGICTVFEEISNNYGYDSSIPTHYVQLVSISSGGTVGAPVVVLRGVGLASKSFIVNSQIYFLAAYQSAYQPTYFLINGSLSTQASPVIVAKLAYENGGGYLTNGLPSVALNGTTASIAYLYKDLIEALTTVNNSQQTTAGGFYSQTGINLVNFDFTSSGIDTAEIASTLHLSGGFLGMYDGYLPVEQNFFVWPDSVEATWSASGGSIAAQPNGAVNTNAYYYQAIYEWSDNQGNVHRSAPSIPVAVTTTGSGSLGSITVNVPTLRLTMKTQNPVKICLYRWSLGIQVYHEVTSVIAPTLNSTTSDYITFVDMQSDAQIQGNNIIYTNGGVVEDVNGPATNIMTLFDTRLWLVDAEDQNLLWYSKQVIEATPVEMSDLFTLYVAPNTGTTSTTGPITGLAPMDDKLIIFKENAIFYINGTGPDNTGASSQYSQPIFVTSTVGCADQSSIVLMNNGLMFQSNKGIWLLDRGLGVNYIGAAVEKFNASFVNSAQNIPSTNQVRLTLSSGETLMYDYYYNQWGTFKGCPAISSCIYQDLHTYIDQYGRVFQETPGFYLDGSNPVEMGFSTGWMNLAGLQGFQRFYYFYFLGLYYSPHKINVQIGYNYNPSSFHSSLIQPTNYSSAAASPYGDQPSPFGSPINLEQWEIHTKLQKCQSFQIIVDEIYDPALGVAPGPGLTLSGLNMLCSLKGGKVPLRATTTIG